MSVFYILGVPGNLTKGAHLRTKGNSKYWPPKKKPRALYQETIFLFFASLLFGHASWYSLFYGLLVLS